MIVVEERVEELYNSGIFGDPKSTKYAIEELIEGKNLHGSEYTHVLSNHKYQIITGDHVTTTTGTGLVHTAPGTF